MAIISSYPKDSNISLSDKLLGTDAESSLATKNFEIGDFIVFLGTQNIGTQGPIGPQGVQGNTGANGAVGPAGLTWRGIWVSGTAYVANDSVSYNGASWFCISAITGTTPPNANPTNWALLASQGAQGPQGVQGPTGPQGGVGIVPNAQEGVKGIASLASTVEVGQGINGTNIVTPVKLKAVLDLKEDLSNKSIDTGLGGITPSDDLYPSQKAVKTYVDANAGGAQTLQEVVDTGNVVTDGIDTTIVTPGSIGVSNISGDTASLSPAGIQVEDFLGRVDIYSDIDFTKGIYSAKIRNPGNHSGNRTYTLPNASGTVALQTYKSYVAKVDYDSVINVFIDEIGISSPTITNPSNGQVVFTKTGVFTGINVNKICFLSQNLDNLGQVYVTLLSQGGPFGENPDDKFTLNIFDMSGAQTGTPAGSTIIEIRVYN